MSISGDIKTVPYGHFSVQLFVPDPVEVKKTYALQKEKDADIPFPFWAKLWPASEALALFLCQNSQLVQGKRVLELAAGLGLPALVAAHFAQSVGATDYLPEAVAAIGKSAMINKLHNFTTSLLDWNHLPTHLSAEVLLLSDINYEPASFPVLLQMLLRFQRQHTTILLSTPQRLMARPFVEQVLPLCKARHTLAVHGEPISILIL